ncbi:MAG: hypothetical protein SFZ23_06200 [Planctomycetota bacterium]|nr:hypothetical protein [Planctomycetota bacterium]
MAPWLATIALCTVSSLTLAQVGTSTLTWQASLDGGTTWQSNLVEVERSQRTFQVRGWLDWTPDAGAVFFTTTFDCLVSGTTSGDDVRSIFRREPFVSFAPQTLVATRFGDVIKIDDGRDTTPPTTWGGPYGVRLLQPLVNDPRTTRDKPLLMLSFEFEHDGTLGSRRVSSVYNGSGTRDSVPLFWPTVNGGPVNEPASIVVPLDIRVIPAPAAAGALLGMAFVGPPRRQRRFG